MAPARLVEEDERPTVYILDDLHPEAIKYAQSLFHVIRKGDDGFDQWRERAEYIVIRSSYFTAEDVASCPKLRGIGKQGVGIDKIDTAACEARGIKICNTPGVNARAVAELALTLTTSVARDLPHIIVQQSQGKIVPKENCNGIILYKKTLGLVGMGNIGQLVATIFRGAFDADVIAYDPLLPQKGTPWDAIPHTRAATLEEVLERSDVLSLHVPLVAGTRGMIGYEQIKQMKPTAILINTARGGIIDEDGLAHALQENLIWGAGIDAHVQEPPTKEKYGALWAQRVVSTPHIGAATGQTQMETAKAAVEYLYDFAISNKE